MWYLINSNEGHQQCPVHQKDNTKYYAIDKDSTNEADTEAAEKLVKMLKKM